MARRRLDIDIVANDRASRGLRGLGGTLGGLGRAFGDVAKIAGGFLLAEGITAGIDFLKNGFSDSVQAASDLGESLNAVSVIFKQNAQEIYDWGETNANAFGLSQQAFNELAVPLGALLKNAGISLDQTTDYTIALTERAADMASVFNTDVTDALFAIQAGLRGEADPLEQFGVSLSAARVQARALADTGKSVASELTDQELAAARVNLIMAQTADTQGDMANTADSLANRTRISAAAMEDMRAEIGEHLMPLQMMWLDVQAAVARQMAEHLIPRIVQLADWLSANLGPAYERAIELGRQLYKRFTQSGGGADSLREKLAPVTAALSSLWQSLQEGGQQLLPVLQDVWARLVQLFAEHGPAIQQYMSAIVSGVAAALAFLGAAFQAAVWLITTLWDAFGEDLFSAISLVMGWILQVILGLWQQIEGIFKLFTGILTGDWSLMWEGIVLMAEGITRVIVATIGFLWEAITRMFRYYMRGVTNGVSQFGSLLVRLFTGSLSTVRSGVGTAMSWIGSRISAAVSYILGAFRRMGSGISSSVSSVMGLVRSMGSRIVGSVTGLAGRMYRAGRKIVTRIADGIRSAIRSAVSAARSLTDRISGFLPGSPVAEGPLQVLNRGYAGGQIAKMTAEGIAGERDFVQDALRSVLSPDVDPSIDVMASRTTPVTAPAPAPAAPMRVELVYDPPTNDELALLLGPIIRRYVSIKGRRALGV